MESAEQLLGNAGLLVVGLLGLLGQMLHVTRDVLPKRVLARETLADRLETARLYIRYIIGLAGLLCTSGL